MEVETTLYGEIPQIGFRIKNPKKLAFVRLPSEAEWLARFEKQRQIERQVGRQETETDFVATGNSDLALFKAIKVEGDEFDEAEAEWAVGILASGTVSEISETEDGFVVKLRWQFFGIGGETIHSLRCPTMEQVRTFTKQAVRVRQMAHNQTEMRVNMPVAVSLYNALVDLSEGYAKDVQVPPHHKSAVISAVIRAVQTPTEAPAATF